MMVFQNLLVMSVVSFCFVYGAQQLLPLAVRKALATTLLRLPLPVFMVRALEKVTRTPAGGGCAGCGGCARAPARKVATGTGQVSTERILTFHPTLRCPPLQAAPPANQPPYVL